MHGRYTHWKYHFIDLFITNTIFSILHLNMSHWSICFFRFLFQFCIWMWVIWALALLVFSFLHRISFPFSETLKYLWDTATFSKQHLQQTVVMTWKICFMYVQVDCRAINEHSAQWVTVVQTLPYFCSFGQVMMVTKLHCRRHRVDLIFNDWTDSEKSSS